MTSTGPWQWLLICTLLVLGCLFAIDAWRLAVHQTEKGSRIGVLSALGGGLITGLSVGLATLNLQMSFEATTKYATWKADVEAATSIPGFSPGHRDIRGINFSGKSLHDADFTHEDLHGMQFRDADLTGAVFDGADLQGVNFVGADLESTSFMDSNLKNALLQSADLTHAAVNGSAPQNYAGVQVNGRTCWPKNVDREILKTVTVKPFWERDDTILTPQQEQKEDGVRGGEIAPRCHLAER
ncbi:pentapeptide repeat-containing protein [Streptomyces camelliae]|uniref:Pentapeptide repeat-containing protein n=1 Tax=Streptomyces camelliae TaxID=3004093 RepID=A0ABY7NTT6_9ACTN|nr:pentapeptide repeat-containing protein [Streptomyces sp. HUAS 2-6]WBO61636.1 pentapeptide repeat-containing protein [Streptomyces sp. HUAS 2-6]